jgi:hypothetical protein
MIGNHKSYTETFRQLAMRHKLIRHSDTSMHFARITLSKAPVFGRDELREFIQSKKNVLEYPALLLISYDADYSSHHKDSLTKSVNGEFIILEAVEKDNFEQLDDVLDKTEEIGEQLLATLRDHYDDTPEEGLFQDGEMMNEKIAGLGSENLAGTKFYFSITMPNSCRLTHNPDNYIDLEDNG